MWRGEKEHSVFCVREYIYMGGKLLAEYRPADNRYYYYMSDQIGSTRIVTDQNGVVVYAAAHGPYGGIQQTWESGYDPALKFSGKERDTESGLDYFGARYYDHTLYRFLSVDPVVPAGEAVADPQRWNLYAYCGNDPISMMDQNGKWSRKYHYNITYSAMMIAFQDWDPIMARNIAITVAGACADVDTNPFTRSTPLWVPIPGMGIFSVIPDREQRKEWHFPSMARFFDALDIATTTLNPVAFGQALHVVQDFFSHFGYDSDHVLDSLFAFLGMGRDPDSPVDFYDEALAAAYLTLDLCYAYEQRFHEALVFLVIPRAGCIYFESKDANYISSQKTNV